MNQFDYSLPNKKTKFESIIDIVPKKICCFCDEQVPLPKLPNHIRICLKEYESFMKIPHECCCEQNLIKTFKIEQKLDKKKEFDEYKRNEIILEKKSKKFCMFAGTEDCPNPAKSKRVVLFVADKEIQLCKISHLISLSLQKQIIKTLGEKVNSVPCGQKDYKCSLITCNQECSSYFAVGSTNTDFHLLMRFCSFSHMLDQFKNMKAREWGKWVKENKSVKDSSVSTVDLINQTLKESDEDDIDTETSI